MISKELQLGRAGELLALADLLLKGKQGFLTQNFTLEKFLNELS